MSASSSFTEIRQKLHLEQIVPSLSVGLIIGIIEVILAISFAALIFGGPLSPFLSKGIGITLAGAVLTGATVALLTSVPGIVSGNQDVPAAVMAVAAAAIAAAMPASASEDALYTTVAVTIGLTTIATGTFFYILARFRLGNLVRFLPYPVIGGFLAATGWVLLLGGISIMVDVTPTLDTVGWLLEPTQLLRWVPGILLAGTIIIVLRRTDHVMALPVTVFGSVGLFYIFAAFSGQPVAALMSGGWLLGPFPEESLWQPLAFSNLTSVHWPAIVDQIPHIATVVLMSTIALLLNGSGLELAIGKEIGLNRELRAGGIGNVLAGIVGGVVGFQQLSLSTMSHKVSRGSRLSGLFAAFFCALVLYLGASVLSLFPKVILGGLVCYLGLSFLEGTIVSDWSVLPRRDFGVMVLILLFAATIGFMEAIGLGLLVAIILFVIEYSRTEIIRDELSGTTFQSRVTRSPDKCRILNEDGKQLSILRLQGFIFFGTADSLLNRIRGRLDRRSQAPLRYLLLDFHHVTGFDSTAVFSFVKLVKMVWREKVTLVLAEPVSGLLEQVEAKVSLDDTVHVFADLDRALEWCEEQLLAEAGVATSVPSGLHQEIRLRVTDADAARRLMGYFERVEVNAGDTLMRQGEAPDNLYLIESGQMSAYLEEKDGRTVRLQTMQDWNVLGEIGFFLKTRRTASVIAEAPGVIYCLSQNALLRMHEKDPDLVSELQQLIIQLLAERVVHLVTVVDALKR